MSEKRLIVRVLGLQFLIMLSAILIINLWKDVSLPFTHDRPPLVSDDETVTIGEIIRAVFWGVVVASLWEEAVFRGLPLFSRVRSTSAPILFIGVGIGLLAFLAVHEYVFLAVLALFLLGLSRKMPFTIFGVLVASAFWATLHGHGLWLTLALFLVGLIYARLCYKTQSLWPTIKTHAIWNGGVAVASVIFTLAS